MFIRTYHFDIIWTVPSHTPSIGFFRHEFNMKLKCRFGWIRDYLIRQISCSFVSSRSGTVHMGIIGGGESFVDIRVRGLHNSKCTLELPTARFPRSQAREACLEAFLITMLYSISISSRKRDWEAGSSFLFFSISSYRIVSTPFPSTNFSFTILRPILFPQLLIFAFLNCFDRQVLIVGRSPR